MWLTAIVTLSQIESNYTFALLSCCNINMASEKCVSCWQCDCLGGWVWGLREARVFYVSDPETRAGDGLLEGMG